MTRKTRWAGRGESAENRGERAENLGESGAENGVQVEGPVKKEGGKQCPPPGQDWYVKVACGSPKYIACCQSKNYNCEIKPINGRPEPTCVKNERDKQALNYEESAVSFAALKEMGGMAAENRSS